MAEIYDSSRRLVKIGPCHWPPNLDIAFWLSQKDDTILKVNVQIISSPIKVIDSIFCYASLLFSCFIFSCVIFRCLHVFIKLLCLKQQSRTGHNTDCGISLSCPVPVHLSDGRATTLCPAHEVHHQVPSRTPQL